MKQEMLIADWHIDVAARTAERNGQSETLSPRAIRLLRVLSSTAGTTLSRTRLLDLVWPDVFVTDESLTQVVSEVRRKLANRAIIVTVPRGGYRLTAPVIDLYPALPNADAGLDVSFPIDAYTLCIEAIECLSRFDEGALRTAVDLAAQAVAVAPQSADARAYHAFFLFKRHTLWSEGANLLEAAYGEVETALALDPGNALAHFTAAALGLFGKMPRYGWANLERSLSLMATNAGVHADASALVLSQGHRRASIALAKQAARLDRDQFEGEMVVARLMAKSDPVASRVHGKRALQKTQDQISTNPAALPALYARGPLLAHVGEIDAARSAIEAVPHQNSPLEYFRAIGFAQIGDFSSALERVDFLASRGWRLGCFLDIDDAFAPLMSDRKFTNLLGELSAA
ncbi:MAG: winged helix-turn-helix domain-containing protein [Pseudomonadota bacterium]